MNKEKNLSQSEKSQVQQAFLNRLNKLEDLNKDYYETIKKKSPYFSFYNMRTVLHKDYIGLPKSTQQESYVEKKRPVTVAQTEKPTNRKNETFNPNLKLELISTQKNDYVQFDSQQSESVQETKNRPAYIPLNGVTSYGQQFLAWHKSSQFETMKPQQHKLSKEFKFQGVSHSKNTHSFKGLDTELDQIKYVQEFRASRLKSPLNCDFKLFNNSSSRLLHDKKNSFAPTQPIIPYERQYKKSFFSGSFKTSKQQDFNQKEIKSFYSQLHN